MIPHGLGAYAVKVDHVTIAVPNLEEAISFYKVLGFMLHGRYTTQGPTTSMNSAVFKAGAVTVVLVQGLEPTSQVSRFITHFGPGVQHVAIEVRNIEELKDGLVLAGVSFNTRIIEGEGIRQVFTRRDAVSGMMYEFIERTTNQGDFTKESLEALYTQLELGDAF